jgi:SAM-dependent methyltransferase
MNRFIHGMVRAVSETFDLPGPVLEVGSYQVSGQEALADVRPLFPGREYVGLDMRPGPGVDLVADVERLPLPDASVGTVLALNTFEHVRRFWVALDEVRRVLRPDGALLLSCPFFFHVHNYPSDYWRFTPGALASLLEDYPGRLLGWHGPKKRPANVWALALRGRTVTPHEVVRYRELMGRYARNPLPWKRWLRCALGQVLFGRVPFAPYLERDKWETECLNPACP